MFCVHSLHLIVSLRSLVCDSVLQDKSIDIPFKRILSMANDCSCAMVYLHRFTRIMFFQIEFFRSFLFLLF